MSFTRNPFGALQPEDEADVDKLGNTKPSESSDVQTRSRPTHQPAVSPPSRRFRGQSDDGPVDDGHKEVHKPNDGARGSHDTRRHGNEVPTRGRQFDRTNSKTVPFATKKKDNQSWGHLEASQLEAAQDKLDPNDPDAPDKPAENKEDTDDQLMTLDEYRKSKPGQGHKLEARKVDDSGDWKDAVVMQREGDDVYFPGKETSNKQRSRPKKEKVVLEFDVPRHSETSSRGRGEGRGRGRGGRGG
ncbi:hypothetical protein BC940DRAFT_297614, partial [Gongronella butleri]